MEQIPHKSESQWKKLQRKKHSQAFTNVKMLNLLLSQPPDSDRIQTNWAEPPGQCQTTREPRWALPSPLRAQNSLARPGARTHSLLVCTPEVQAGSGRSILVGTDNWYTPWSQQWPNWHHVKRTTLESNIQASNPRSTLLGKPLSLFNV